MENNNTLWLSAWEMKSKAYAPYSGFSVGAAVQTQDGMVFSGCNVENSSFGLTSCAERNAIYAAVASGRTDLLVLAVAGSETDPTFPCGACRQVMKEFGIESVVIGTPKRQRVYALNELLPEAFERRHIK